MQRSLVCRIPSSTFLLCSCTLLSLFALQACSSTWKGTETSRKPSSSGSGIWVDGEEIVPGNRTPYNVLGKSYDVMPTSLGYLEIGIASWYGKKFHGRLTSNGETYDMYSLSAAHKALPLPSMVRVTNLDNGKKTILRVNDRGPFHDDRIIDLSYKAAMELGFANKGTAPVVVEAIDDQNYPELVHNHDEDPATNSSYFLQIGAFSRVQGAETLMQQIQDLMVIQTQIFPVRILQSELTSGILYKVWIGPIDTESEEEEIATLVVDAALGTPIKVEIE
jgi:rare lipoprotein A